MRRAIKLERTTRSWLRLCVEVPSYPPLPPHNLQSDIKRKSIQVMLNLSQFFLFINHSDLTFFFLIFMVRKGISFEVSI